MKPVSTLRRLLDALGPVKQFGPGAHPRDPTYVTMSDRLLLVLYYLRRSDWCTCQLCMAQVLGKKRADVSVAIRRLAPEAVRWSLKHPPRRSFVPHDGARRRLYSITEAAEARAGDLLARARAVGGLVAYTSTGLDTSHTNVDVQEGV